MYNYSYTHTICVYNEYLAQEALCLGSPSVKSSSLPLCNMGRTRVASNFLWQFRSLPEPL